MLTLITSTWGIWLIGALCGGVIGHGIGYDSCFKDKIEIDRTTEYLFGQRKEFLDMAKKDLKGESLLPMSKEYFDTARKFAVKVGTHNDC